MSGTRISNIWRKITVVLIICLFGLKAEAKYGGGSGEPNDPYLIYDANHMQAIGADSNDWGKHFKLMADIDLSAYTETAFNIIGTGYYECPPIDPFCFFVGNPFTGTFDGNGHTISNFTHTSTDIICVGIFGYIDDPNAEIKNLGLVDPNVDAEMGRFVGSLVGRIRDGTITGCYVEGGSVLGGNDVGGLVGDNYDGTIINCCTSSDVSGEYAVGGLVGDNFWNGTVTNCYATGTVLGYSAVGGLVGDNWDGTISKCYSTGDVAGDWRVGGLVGENFYSSAIANCYSTGSVSGNEDIGGLIGSNVGTIANCYAIGAVNGTEDTGGLVGSNSGHVVNSYWNIETGGPDNGIGIPKITAEMKMASTFFGWGLCEGIWTIDEGADYPRLVWEEKLGEPIVSSIPLQGDGNPNNPYLIYTPEELNVIGLLPCAWDNHFKLMTDVDLSGFMGTSFNIIGINSDNPFSGVFDGSGHTIFNFSFTSTDKDNIGLFGYVSGFSAEIKNLRLIDPNVDAGTGMFVGSLVGGLYNGKITNCYVEGGSVSGSGFGGMWYGGVGGLVGENRKGIISSCYSEASVAGRWYVGGIVGGNYYGTIINCRTSSDVSGEYAVGGLVGDNYWNATITNSYSTGTVSGSSAVGGLCGENYGGSITNCYSIGRVSGTTDVGGLVGYNYYGTITKCCSSANVWGDFNVGGLVGLNEIGTIINCYSTGFVIGSNYVGGLVGLNDIGAIINCYSCSEDYVVGYYRVGGLVGKHLGIVSNCYSTRKVTGGGLIGENWGNVAASFWDIETSGQDWSDGGAGLPTAQMQMQVTFTDAGWDFVGETFNGIKDIWFIPKQDYPHLWWEGMKVPMKLTPRTLNCRSYGNWVKAHLTLPEGFTVEDVNSNRPAVLHSFGFESAPLYIFVNKDKLVEIEAAFEREAVCSLAGDWPEALTVAGFLTDGNIFLGTSTVRIIHPGLKVIEELASCWLQGDCVHPTWCDRIDMNRDSMVNLLDYALFMNIKVEFVTDE